MPINDHYVFAFTRRTHWGRWYPQKHSYRESFYPGVYASRIYGP